MLSRQWKNVLYTPLLLEHNYKTKHVKPLNVTFAVQDPDEVLCSPIITQNIIHRTDEIVKLTRIFFVLTKLFYFIREFRFDKILMDNFGCESFPLIFLLRSTKFYEIFRRYIGLLRFFFTSIR